MSEESPRSTRSWQEIHEHAQTRPTMYIGDQATAHRIAIVECLRLVWQAKVFRHPRSVTIDLSPTQYIVRVECGPLIRPVQQNFRFGVGQTLGQPWPADSRAYSEKFAREEEERGIPYSRRRWSSGWRYCFSGPLGPRLSAPSNTFILARCAVWGLRTNDGLWCESYQEGIPVSVPFLLSKPSSIGLFSAADLDPEWFTSLPFTEEDVHWFRGLAHKRYWSHPKHEPRRFWTPGDITANWHPKDDLVSDRLLTAEGLQDLL